MEHFTFLRAAKYNHSDKMGATGIEPVTTYV